MTITVGYQEVHLQPGQFIFGRRKAAEETGLSEKQIRLCMDTLKFRSNVAIKTASKFSIVSIINLETYQGGDTEEGPAEGPAKGQQRATNNNVKNEKKTTLSGKKTPDQRVKQFFEFWGETFLQETGKPYVLSFGKEGKLVKDLLKVHSLELLQDTVRSFFKDERCKYRGLTIGIFFQEINRLLSTRAMDPLEQAKKELGMRSDAAPKAG